MVFLKMLIYLLSFMCLLEKSHFRIIDHLLRNKFFSKIKNKKDSLKKLFIDAINIHLLHVGGFSRGSLNRYRPYAHPKITNQSHLHFIGLRNDTLDESLGSSNSNISDSIYPGYYEFSRLLLFFSWFMIC